MKINELCSKIAEAIFEEKPLPNELNICSFKGGLLKGWKNNKGWSIIEQNPSKNSKWAHLARDGHHILWVFKNGSYYARYVDGELTIL